MGYIPQFVRHTFDLLDKIIVHKYKKCRSVVYSKENTKFSLLHFSYTVLMALVIKQTVSSLRHIWGNFSP